MGEINMSDADNYDIDFSSVETLTLKYDFLNYFVNFMKIPV